MQLFQPLGILPANLPRESKLLSESCDLPFKILSHQGNFQGRHLFPHVDVLLGDSGLGFGSPRFSLLGRSLLGVGALLGRERRLFAAEVAFASMRLRKELINLVREELLDHLEIWGTSVSHLETEPLNFGSC